MLYNFLYPLHIDYSWLNVFRYITFRAIGSSITALLFVIIVGPIFIAWLKKKQIGQVIREDGPESHFSKQGVPTMGGVLILAAMIFYTFIWADLTNGLV